jgi:hypothetical protein
VQQFFGGLALGALLGVGGFFAYQTMTPKPECGGLCGEGTRCELGVCIVAAPEEPEVNEEVVEDDKGKRKSKRRRGSKSGEGDAALEAAATGNGPPIDDDSGVPRFDPNADQTIGAADGSERLSDSVIDRELGKLDKQFQACVRDANERVEELGSGTVKYSFGVAGSGKVTGVNASAPANLEAAGIVPCVRKAVYAHKFPIFNGPDAKVSSSFSVK